MQILVRDRPLVLGGNCLYQVEQAVPSTTILVLVQIQVFPQDILEASAERRNGGRVRSGLCFLYFDGQKDDELLTCATTELLREVLEPVGNPI